MELFSIRIQRTFQLVSTPKSNPKLIKVVTLNSNRNSNPKLKITTRKGIKKGSHKLPNQHSKK